LTPITLTEQQKARIAELKDEYAPTVAEADRAAGEYSDRWSKEGYPPALIGKNIEATRRGDQLVQTFRRKLEELLTPEQTGKLKAAAEMKNRPKPAAPAMTEPATFSPAGKDRKVAPAALAPAVEIKLTDVRWQALPEQVAWVTVSPDQRVWYVLRPPSPSAKLRPAEVRQIVESEFAKPSPQLQGVQRVFFETVGSARDDRTKVKRVWLLCDEMRGCDLLLGYDGKQWIERRSKADYFLRESPAGRAFVQLADGVACLDYNGCHVLKGTEWIYQNFQTDAKNRTSRTESRMWVDADGKGLVVLAAPGTVGLWKYREGIWSDIPLPEKEQGRFLTRNVARFEDHFCIRRGGGLIPRPPGMNAARYAELLRSKPELSASLPSIGLDGKTDELKGDETLSMGPYRVPAGSPLYNDVNGCVYAACQEVLQGKRRLGAGVVSCDLAGKAHFVPAGDPQPLRLPQLADIRVFSTDGKRAWRNLRPAALWDMEKLTCVGQLPDAEFVVLAALDDGTTFAGCPTQLMHDQYSQLMVFRPNAPDPRTPLAGKTVKIHGAGFCIGSDGCIWAPCGDFGLERFDGNAWRTVSDLKVKATPYTLIPAQNGWVVTFVGHRVSDLRIENGLLLTSLFGPQFLLLDGRKCHGNVSLKEWFAECREQFLKAFSQPCPNRPWYDSRPMIARYVKETGRVDISHMDVYGDGIVMDKNKNVWVNALGRLTVVAGTREIVVATPGRSGNRAERLGEVDGIALLGEGEYVFIRRGDNTTFFARLRPKGDVEFVDGPKVADDDHNHWVGTLRDHQGGLWVTLRRGFKDLRNPGTIACRMTATDQGQDFRDVGEAELVDASGCVWLAPIKGMGGDLVTIWVPGGETSTLKIPGRKAGSPLAAGPKGRVFAKTAFGVQECVAEDPAKPGKYALGTVYRLETSEGEALSRLQYSSLGYLVATGFREGAEDSLSLHLYPLDQARLNRQDAPAAKQPGAKDAGDESATEPAKPRPASAPAQLRTWKDATGDFSVEAELVRAGAGIVNLRKADGSTIKVPMEKLSDEDQQYIRKRGR
jgi:hypothetical protein